MAARVREAEARLRAEEEAAEEWGGRGAPTRGGGARGRAQLGGGLHELAAVEAERQLQQEDQGNSAPWTRVPRRRSATCGRQRAEEAVEEGEHRELRSLWHGGPTAASLASPAGSSGARLLEPHLRQRWVILGARRHYPPTSCGAEQRETRDGGGLEEQYPAHPALALDRPPSGGVSDSDPLQTLADTPATSWVSPTSAAKAAAAEAAAAAAPEAYGAQGSERQTDEPGGARVLGAVSQEVPASSSTRPASPPTHTHNYPYPHPYPTPTYAHTPPMTLPLTRPLRYP